MDMQMVNRVPDWLTPVAWTYIALSLLSATWIVYEISARNHRHASPASDLVWVTSALYLWPFAIAPHHAQVRVHDPGFAPCDAEFEIKRHDHQQGCCDRDADR